MGCGTSKDRVGVDKDTQVICNEEDSDTEPEGSYQPLTEEEVNARIQSCEKTLTHRLGDTGITLRWLPATVPEQAAWQPALLLSADPSAPPARSEESPR